jgi:serine protease Do
MFKRYLIPICLIATSIFVTPSEVNAIRETRAILAREVGSIAKKTVVRIESSEGSFGSGVIIGRTEKGNKNIYTVLTAAHVVRNPDRYSIVTPRIVLNNSGRTRRKRIKIDSQRNIKILPNVDLAVVSFESDYVFEIGTIGNSAVIDEGSPVYVAGFPKPGRAIKRSVFQFTGGMVSSRSEEIDPDVNIKQQNTDRNNNNGYELVYTSITRAGMSGGPVLDAAGRIIAIHGQGDRDNSIEATENSAGIITPIEQEKTGFNLGIPIGTFLKIQPQANKMMGARLNLSPVNYELDKGSNTSSELYIIGTNNQKFNKKVRTRSTKPLFNVMTVKERDSVEEEISD